ncbi:MAG: hypothetical protein ACMG6H_03220 [Acidobacteriota bacterium]
MDSANLTAEFEKLYQGGESLGRDVQEHLNSWPLAQANAMRKDLPDPVILRIEELRDRAHRWFNELTIHVIPQTTFERTYTNLLLRRLGAAIKAWKFYEEFHEPWYTGSASLSGTMEKGGSSVRHNVERPFSLNGAKEEASEVIGQALRLIRTAATSPLARKESSRTTEHLSNTAFILMWMDKNHPELEDVHQAVKEVFAEFGVKALRADEIQHQDRITDLILNQISQSEFLFADLTGERPNVYYEVGYAHALEKHPILYRRANTSLHFDLSIHNVPEYENVTQLRALLRQRLEAITRRVPKRSDQD